MGRRKDLSLNLLPLLLLISIKSNKGEYIEDCGKFLASEPFPVSGMAEKDDSFHIVNWDGNYRLDHKIDLNVNGVIAENKGTTSLCVGIVRTTSHTRNLQDTEDKDSLAWVETETSGHVTAGIVNVTAECWAKGRQMFYCNPIFMPMPEIMNVSMLAFSPLNEKFWTQLQDKNLKEAWLTKISIINNSNKTIPSSWIPNLQISSLESLQISGNNWGRPQELISPLPLLERLDLTNNSIQELPQDTFNNTPMVRDIILAKNNFSVFPSGLDELTYLSLLDITNPVDRAQLVISQDQISTIHHVHTMGLENINLSANITALLDLTNIGFLNLSGCGIEKINDIVSESKSPKPLHRLDLSKNKLKELPRKLFSRLNNIISLYLQYNMFEKCPEFIIENLVDLTELNLSHNKISHLTTLCFEKPHLSLTVLDLSHNELSQLTDRIFRTLFSLRVLILSNNKITTIQSSVFEGVTYYLNKLDLSSNQITSEIYFQAIHIDELNLSNNRIHSLANMSDTQTKFDLIDVSRNNLSDWAMNYPSAETLNLSYNAISNLSEEMRLSFDRNVKLLDLGGNFINCCDNELNKTKEWLKNTEIDIQNMGTKQVLKCIIPGENQKYPIRTFIDEEELCPRSSTTVHITEKYTALYGVISGLAILVCLLSIALGYVIYKHKSHVLPWIKFSDE